MSRETVGGGRSRRWLRLRSPHGGSRPPALASLSAVLLPAVSVLLVVVLALVVIAAADRSERRQAGARMRATAALASAYVHEQVTGLAELVGAYALRPQLVMALSARPGDPRRAAAIRSVLASLRAERTGFAYSLLTDARGRLLGADPPLPWRAGADYSASDWYRGAIAGKRRYVSEVHRAVGETGEPFVVTAAALVRGPPAAGRPGRVLGVLAGSYLVNSFQRWVRAYQRSEGVRLQIVDQRGVLAAAALAGGATADLELRRAAGAEALRARRGVVSASSRDPATGWTVVSEVPVSQALAPAAQQRRLVLAAAGLLILLLLGGAALRARSARIRQAAEQALRDSEERFRLLAENSTDMIMRMTAEWVALYVSPACRRLLGYEPEELVGRSMFTLVHPDDLAAAVVARQELAVLEGSATITLRNRHHDGQWVWLEAIYRITRSDADGQPLEVSLSARDVTERKRGEATLLAQQEQTRMIIATASDPFISMDPHGTVTEWNRRAEVVFGWSREEAVGRELAELIIPEADRQAHRDGLRRVLAGGERRVLDRRVDVTALHRDGRELPVELAVWQMGSGSGRSFNAFVRDISERRQAEEVLAAARDQALAASQLKSQFVATMSHEIRTPMNGVIGLTGLLLDSQLDDTQRRYAEGIRTAGDALLGVINDILDFSKIEAGKLILDEVDFNLGLLVEEVVEMVAQPARAKGLELVGCCQPELPPAVRGDPGRLRQVLLNLASNAVKFTENGEVVVRAGLVERTPPAERMTVRFEVIDTGIGIPVEVRDRLFEPFSQADASTTRDYGGTGLGLAICRHLVDAMGGQLGADSQVGRGSTFWCTVPLQRQPLEQAPAAPAGDSPLEDVRVLVVDDNQTSRTTLEQQLQAWTTRPEAVESGQRALERLRIAAAQGQPHQLAILDLQMPGMSGMELAQRITADPAIPAIPLVLLTSGGYIDIESAREAGILASLTKPVHQSQLYNCLLQLLTLTPAASPDGHLVAGQGAGPPPRRGHVLLVEDNEINRTVAVGILSKLGYSVDVAGNGLEAVDRAARKIYGAVLMDCQMPEMDGYAATRELRRLEGVARHTPIIAMTAGALKEDRERCLAAGMDDYISKPVKRAELDATLSRWLGRRSSVVPGGLPEPEAELVQTAIERRLDELRGSDPVEDGQFLSALIGSFLSEAPTTLAAIAAAVERGDATAVEEQAHYLKGAAGTIGAARLAALCGELEAAGRGHHPREAAPLIGLLQAELNQVRSALDSVLSRL